MNVSAVDVRVGGRTVCRGEPAGECSTDGEHPVRNMLADVVTKCELCSSFPFAVEVRAWYDGNAPRLGKKLILWRTSDGAALEGLKCLREPGELQNVLGQELMLDV
jgi:hypothetical protein